MHIDNEPKLDFCDVQLLPNGSNLKSRKEIVLEREFQFYHSPKKWKGIPIIAANMDSTGTFDMAKVLSKHKMITALHKHYSFEDLTQFLHSFDNPNYIAYSMGIRDKDFQKLESILDEGLENKFNFICLDVPNAYLDQVIEKFSKVRSLCPNHIIMAGNVVTAEQTIALIKYAKADIVKVGIGSGSACTTRRQTGVGRPQLTSIFECSDAAHNLCEIHKKYGLIVSDGGIIDIGDISKAYCGGADFIMMGSKFAGFEESGGENIEIDGKIYKEFYGMSSTKAMNKHYKGVANYRSSEGRELLIPHKGPVEFFLNELKGGLRSTATYIGAKTLKDFNKKARFEICHRILNRSLEKYDA